MATSEKKCVSPAEKIGIWHCAAVPFSQVPKWYTDLDLSLLYILTSGTYSELARKNNFLALGVCFPQPARALAAGLPRQDHVYKTTDESFCFNNKNSMKCVVNWIPLRIRVRLTNNQPKVEGGKLIDVTNIYFLENTRWIFPGNRLILSADFPY